jgi:hypothetical protein
VETAEAAEAAAIEARSRLARPSAKYLILEPF